MNANDATLTALATAHTGSRVGDPAPNAPAAGAFDLVLGAVAGSALGSSGAPYTLTITAIDLTAVTQGWPTQTLHQAFDAASGWTLSGAGPGYQWIRTFAVPRARRWPWRPAGRSHPAVRGVLGQPGRPDRRHHPQQPVRPCLNQRA